MLTDQRGWMKSVEYDEECRATRKRKKKNVGKLVRKFRKSLNRAESVDYCCARREYKKKTVAAKEKEIQ